MNNANCFGARSLKECIRYVWLGVKFMFMSFNFEFHCNYVEFRSKLFIINRTIIVALPKWTKGSHQNFEVGHIKFEISLEMVDNNI